MGSAVTDARFARSWDHALGTPVVRVEPLPAGSVWRSFAELAKELGEPVHNVKREVRRLARAGVLEYTQLFDHEMKLSGGGYVLTPAWFDHQAGREGDPQ